MKIKVSVPFLQGKWIAPTSKSELIRYIAIAMQCEDVCSINNISWCNDSYTMLNIAELWGANIELNQQKLKIKGIIYPNSQIYNAGESALCLRLMIPILSKFSSSFTIHAEGSLLNRPIGEIDRILRQINAEVTSQKGFPPVQVRGAIKPSDISVEYSLSSQNISGLLMTLPLLNGNSSIKLKRLISLPYIKVTLKCLADAGVGIQANETYTEYFIAGNQQFTPFNMSVEGDWSAASVVLAAAAVFGDVQAQNLSLNSFQADKQILNYINSKNLSVNSQEIKAFNADITHCPDLFPALVLLALHANGICEIQGMNRLIHKESNRIETFIQEFSKFGAKFSLVGDKLTIRPPMQIESCQIDTHNDHRIAMAAALAVTGTKAHVILNNANCVNKSYPSFWEDISCLGANVQKI